LTQNKNRGYDTGSSIFTEKGETLQQRITEFLKQQNKKTTTNRTFKKKEKKTKRKREKER